MSIEFSIICDTENKQKCIEFLKLFFELRNQKGEKISNSQANKISNLLRMIDLIDFDNFKEQLISIA